MNNQTKKQTKPKQSKKQEHEDFFTVCLAKKVRNLKKKQEHIAELEAKVKAGEELKSQQKDTINRKQELIDQIADCDRIKLMYVDAWFKKDDVAGEEVKAPATETKADRKQSTPQVNVAEVEAKASASTIAEISKLMITGHLMRNKQSCDMFAESLDTNSSELAGLFDFVSNLFTSQNGNNSAKLESTTSTLTNYLKNSDSFKLVNSLVASDKFADFVPMITAPKPQTPLHKPKTPKAQSRKQSEKSMTKSRKESEAQQDVFMEDDDEDEEEVKKVAEVVEKKVEAASPKKEERKISNNERKKSDNKKPVKKNEDDDEDEWFVAKRPEPRAEGARGRGGRGRGERGGYSKNYRGGDKKPYERKDKDGNVIQVPEGERRPYTEGGNRWQGERGEKVEYTFVDKDGVTQTRFGYPRGSRGGRGGRGRGGRGGRGGYKDGERKANGEVANFRQAEEGDHQASEEVPKKEIGTAGDANVKTEVEAQS